MSDRIMKNRIRLASLIYSMGTFTEKDLINQLRRCKIYF